MLPLAKKRGFETLINATTERVAFLAMIERQRLGLRERQFE
jgi:hypothetical protein